MKMENKKVQAKILILSVISVLLTSCITNKTTDTTNKLNGTWYLYSSTINGKTKVIDYDGFVKHDFCSKKNTLKFDNNKFEAVKISFGDCSEEIKNVGNYQIKGNKLTFKYEKESIFESKLHPFEPAIPPIIKTFKLTNGELRIKGNDENVNTYKRYTP